VRIFLFEDNTEVGIAVRDAIHRETKHLVVGMAQSVDATAQLDRFQPDIVVTDLDLMGGSGFDVLSSLLKRTMPVVAVVLSNHSADTFRSRAEALGARHFFDKSFEWEKFLEFLRSLPPSV